jgi:hypothetical protein
MHDAASFRLVGAVQFPAAQGLLLVFFPKLNVGIFLPPSFHFDVIYLAITRFAALKRPWLMPQWVWQRGLNVVGV